MAIISEGITLQSVWIRSRQIQSVNGNNVTLDLVTGDVLPKTENSAFHITLSCPTNTSDRAIGSDSNPYRGFRIFRSINGGSFSFADYIGNNTYTQSHCDASPYRAGDTTNYNQGARYRMTHKHSQIIDRPSYSLGDTITYKLQIHPRDGGYGGYVRVGATYPSNYFNFPYGLIVKEVVE